MTKLTKKELQIILLDMRFYASQSKPLNESPVHRELREKVEDMIENCCEHKEVMGIERVFPADYRCMQCGLEFGGHELRRLANNE